MDRTQFIDAIRSHLPGDVSRRLVRDELNAMGVPPFGTPGWDWSAAGAATIAAEIQHVW